MRFVVLFCLASGLGFGQISGFLVDAKCFDAMERNVNPTDTMTSVDRDRNFEIRYCSPNAKSMTFTLVDQDSLSYKLDADGNTKAGELVRKIGKRKKKYLEVDITGEVVGYTIKVDSIDLAQ